MQSPSDIQNQLLKLNRSERLELLLKLLESIEANEPMGSGDVVNDWINESDSGGGGNQKDNCRILNVKIQFLRNAYKDEDRSKNYYKENYLELAIYFQDDIKHALNHIRIAPFSTPRLDKFEQLRLKICNRFPFSIIYHKQDSEPIIFIIAIAHHRRNPDYWSDRLNDNKITL